MKSLAGFARHSFLVLAAVVIAALALTLVLGWQFGERSLRLSVQDSTEASNRTLTRVFVNENWETVKPLLPAPGSSSEAARSNQNLPTIDQIVRRFSLYTDVVKVKIYDRGGITVYSSDPAQIGEDKARNAGFQAAAQGEVASEMNYRGKFGAFDGEIFDRNLVSTYVPVRVGDRIEAVLEIYADRTSSINFLNREMRHLATELIPWVLAALLAVIGVLWWVHRSQRAAVQSVVAAGDQAGRAAAGPVDAALGEYAHPIRLSKAFDGLAALAARVRAVENQSAPANQDPATPSSRGAVRNGELDVLLARIIAIDGWARMYLDVEHLRRVDGSVSLETFDLDATINEVVAGAALHAASRGCSVSDFRYPSTLGLVRAERKRIVSVLAHMIGAAIEAPWTPTPGRVQCKLLREGANLRIEVLDDSAGLPQEDLDRWFADWDARHALPPAESESGMRLVIARFLVQRSGGRFVAHGTPGHGNRWSADLPLEMPGDTGAAVTA